MRRELERCSQHVFSKSPEHVLGRSVTFTPRYSPQLSIQIRILKQVLRADAQRQVQTSAIWEHILNTPSHTQTSLPPYHESLPRPLNTPGFYPGLISPHNEGPPLAPGEGLLLEVSYPNGNPGPLNPLDLPGLPTLDDSSAPVTFPEPVHYSSLPAPPVVSAVPKDPSTLNSQEVMATLARVTQIQNSNDLAHDTAALRQLLRKALAASDDLEMLQVLQVKKEEMPEAIKALQRALEHEITREREAKERQAPAAEDGQLLVAEEMWTSPVEDLSDVAAQELNDDAAGRSSPLHGDPARKQSMVASSSQRSKSGSSNVSRDTLDREFIESSIESLVRLSTSEGVPPAALTLPSWTITRYEVERDAKIGVGYFSEVWRGSYRGRTVAIKVLAPWTPKELFVREVIVWNELRHPNVLELIGASACEVDGQTELHASKSGGLLLGMESSVHSAATGLSEANSGWDVPEEARSPWFFVSRFYARGSLVKWVKGLERPAWDVMLSDGQDGALRLMHEIVKGMVYLHDKGIFHGDLKVRLLYSTLRGS